MNSPHRPDGVRRKFRFLLLLAVAAADAHALVWQETMLSVAPKPGSDVVVATYHFINDRAQPVQITSVHTGCGCTDAMVSASEIPPRGAGYIQVVFTFGQRTGHQEKEVLVTSDDTKEPVKLTLKTDLPPARAKERATDSRQQ